MNKSIEMVRLADIVPDKNQPRKVFDPARLADLASSIRKHGIMNPLKLEKAPGGKFVIIDGERRFRAAKQMRLLEVPAIVENAMDDTARLIEQFHLQEQHEGWSAAEKAVAVAQLAENMDMTIGAMADVLNLPQSTISDYMSFSKIIDKKAFLSGDIGLTYAKGIISLRSTCRKAFLDHEQEFTHQMEVEIEDAVIARIKSGDIRKSTDITKIADAARMDIGSIAKFLKNQDMATDRLFIESNAKSAYHERNAINGAAMLGSHLRKVLELPGGLALLQSDSRAKSTLVIAEKAIKETLALL